MTFLTPWSALVAAALTVPLLMLLYLLRLRRQRLSVPTTLLWMKSFEDLQANAPFQRLRWSLLLLLQLLLLLTLLLAAAQPVLHGREPIASRLVLLIDRSASMNATIRDAESGTARTRLDLAKEAASRMVEDLGRAGTAHQIMIIAFASSAQVMTAYETNRTTLLDAIAGIQPSDEQANLSAALELSGAFAASADEQSDPPDVVLLSDGCVGSDANREAYRLSAGNFRFTQVTPDAAVNNIGITSFSVRRDDEDPARVLVFARLINAGENAVDTVVTLSMDDQPVTAIRRTVPPATAETPGEQSVSHEMELPGGGVLALRHNHVDDLAADNHAWLIVPEPVQPRIALVHPSDASADPFLEDLLLAMEPQRFDVLSAGAFVANQSNVRDLYDLIVFDRVAAAQWPAVPSLTFGTVPLPLRTGSDEAVDKQAPLAGQVVLSWDRQHPLMRQVSLDTIVFAGQPMRLAAQETRLTTVATGPNGPIIVEHRDGRAGGARHVLIGFEFRRSNWPLHVSSAIFMQNAIDTLTPARQRHGGIQFRPSEQVHLRAGNDASQLLLTGPVRIRVPVRAGEDASIAAPPFAGLYQLDGVLPPMNRIAVNVASDVESDIRPRQSVTVSAQSIQARAAAENVPHPLWPWLIGAALVLLVLEWMVYSRRSRG